MKLGIVWKDGHIINHRSFIKVVFNPILRFFGVEIASESDLKTIQHIVLQKCKRKKIKWEKYDCKYDYIEKKRRIF